MFSLWLDMLYALYGSLSFATFLRGSYLRQLDSARNTAEPNQVEAAIHEKLWKIREKFEGLFKDETHRKNALNLFPELRDLEEIPTHEKSANVMNYPAIVMTSITWPIAVPITLTKHKARQRAANEAAEREQKQDIYNTLAEHEEFGPLADAFRSGDDELIVAAIMQQAEINATAQKMLEKSPELVLEENR